MRCAVFTKKSPGEPGLRPAVPQPASDALDFDRLPVPRALDRVADLPVDERAALGAAGLPNVLFVDMKSESDRLYSGYLREAGLLSLGGLAAIDRLAEEHRVSRSEVIRVAVGVGFAHQAEVESRLRDTR